MKNIAFVFVFFMVIGCGNSSNNSIDSGIANNNGAAHTIDAGSAIILQYVSDLSPRRRPEQHVDASTATIPVSLVHTTTAIDQFNHSNDMIICDFSQGVNNANIHMLIWNYLNKGNVDIGFRHSTFRDSLHYNETNLWVDAMKDGQALRMPRFGYHQYDADHINRNETLYWWRVSVSTLRTLRPSVSISFRVRDRDTFTINRNDFDICMQYICANNHNMRCNSIFVDSVSVPATGGRNIRANSKPAQNTSVQNNQVQGASFAPSWMH